jgi:glycosyltransferase involved in cell wall biosynthesis
MLPNKKLCLITNRYPIHPDDVASPFVRDFHLGLKKRGIDVSVFTPYYLTCRSDWEKEVIRFRWSGGKKVVGALNPFNSRELSQILSFFRNGKRELLEHLNRNKADACLALWALPSGWFAYQAKKKLGIPYSVWCLGSDIYIWAEKPILRNLTRKILQNAQHLFADGWDLCERVRKLSGKECHFLPSMRKLPPAVEHNQLVDSDKFNFLYVGRWEKKKGLEELIRAFGQVKQNLSSANLHILGWGEFENQMRGLITTLKLEDVVKVIGQVPTGSVSNYIKQSNCLVIPSQGDSIPLVFSEALQMGTPLIVTDVGDMGKLVKKFDLGKIVPAGDSSRLSSAMIEFIIEKKDYSRKVPDVLELLDPEKAVDDFLNIVFHQRCSKIPTMTVSV